MSAEKILKRFQSLRSERMRHESVWRECFDYTAPARGAGIDGDETFDANTLQAKRARVLSSVAGDGAENLAANLVSGVVPSNARWFDLDVQGASDGDKRWLSESAATLWTNIHAANFDAEVFDAMLDIVCAGWFALYVDENREQGGFTFELWPMSQCYIASTQSGGVVDIVYRSFKLTAEQAVATFNRRGDKLSDTTRRLAQDRPDAMVHFVQCIEPNRLSVAGAMLAKNLPVRSTTIEVDAKATVRESGYHEMPVVVPRWSRLPKSPYATGPVESALPEVRMLNKLRWMETQASELAISGMWIAEDDGVLNPKAVKVGPRKIIVANSVDSMKPLMTGADFKVAWTKAEDLERQIRKRLLADQLQPQDGPAMTATEVHARMALMRQLLGPVFGRMQAEFLQPLITRCFGIAYRAGVLGAAPESLAGRKFAVRYISPLARSQKMEDVTAITQYGEFVAQQVAAGFPEARDLYDADEASRAVGDGLGVPKRIIPDARRIAAVREARKKDQQQQQQQSMQMEAAASMNDAMAKRMAAA